MKFVSYKYWLNEKFTEDSDPIQDMGIGLYTLLENEFRKLENMGLMNASFYLFDNKLGYAKETKLIIDFLEEAIHRKDKSFQDAFNHQVTHYHGYYYARPAYNKYEQLNVIQVLKQKFGIDLKIVSDKYEGYNYFTGRIEEKFTEDSDPIQDMGIGLIKLWKKEHKLAGGEIAFDTSQRYFGTVDYSEEVFAVYIIMKEIIQNKSTKSEEIQKIFDDLMLNKIPEYIAKCMSLNLHKIKEALKRYYHIDVEVPEKFVELIPKK